MPPSADSFQFLYQQDQPELICKLPEATPWEYNIGNAFYGIGDIIREYAGLPKEVPLPFALEHFVPYAVDQIHQRDITDGLPVFLSTTSERARAYEAAGMPTAHPIGFTLLYAIRLYHRKHGRSSRPRRGTIVFPHKSTKTIRRDFDHDTFADWLMALPQEYHPVVVNLYWADYQQGKHAVYESRGLQVVSCGHLYDNQFLLRFYDLCRQFRYACSNAFASSFPLSVLCGCQYFYKETIGHRQEFQGKHREFDADPTAQSPRAQEALALSVFPPQPGGLIRQVKLARQLAGSRYLRFGWTLRRYYRTAYRMLLSQRGPGLEFSQPVPRKSLHPWLPEGLSDDGWLQNPCSLFIPSTLKQSSLHLTLEFPAWSNVRQQIIEVFAGDTSLGEVKLHPGTYTLSVFPPLQKTDQRISLRATSTFQISEQDAREVTGRLLRFALGTQSHEKGKRLKLETLG
ncbi:hypothetical protein [Verrucomicrobium sp. BvORR106]|uniref:hypothetical protein n=1 Tax=Verrucomicrobium sp. BvORR106 TaxID=1403819 RepID=UPI0005717C17|nr:hypothetical protein [Verrucomicrobium sp. BvORR106]